eukprot:g599.t1
MQVHYADVGDDEDVSSVIVRKFVDIVYCQCFQAPSDRDRVQEILNDMFPASRMSGHDEAPTFDVNGGAGGYVRIGSTYLPTAMSRYDVTHRARLILTPKTIEQLELIAAASQSGLPTLLEGDTCAGKTALIKQLAFLCKRKLVVVSMTHETETTDLLGQWMPSNSAINAEEEETKASLQKVLEMTAKHYLVGILPFVAFGALSSASEAYTDQRGAQHDQVSVPAGHEVQKFQALEKELIEQLVDITTDLGILKQEYAFDAETFAETLLVRIAYLEDIERNCEKEPNGFNMPSDECKRVRIRTAMLKQKLRTMKESVQNLAIMQGEDAPAISFKFEEAEFVEAIKQGYWVLLDNVNSAAPEVVERLNSLMESTPVLNLYEHADGDEMTRDNGKIHTDWRIFATANLRRPGSNKLSSALLNRMLRISLPELDIEPSTDPLNSFDEDKYQVAQICDGLLKQTVGGNQLSAITVKMHNFCKQSANTTDASNIVMPEGFPFTLRTALHTIHAAQALMERAENEVKVPVNAFVWGIVQNYVSCLDSDAGQRVVLQRLIELLEEHKGGHHQDPQAHFNQGEVESSIEETKHAVRDAMCQLQDFVVICASWIMCSLSSDGQGQDDPTDNACRVMSVLLQTVIRPTSATTVVKELDKALSDHSLPSLQEALKKTGLVVDFRRSTLETVYKRLKIQLKRVIHDKSGVLQSVLSLVRATTFQDYKSRQDTIHDVDEALDVCIEAVRELRMLDRFLPDQKFLSLLIKEVEWLKDAMGKFGDWYALLSKDFNDAKDKMKKSLEDKNLRALAMRIERVFARPIKDSFNKLHSAFSTFAKEASELESDIKSAGSVMLLTSLAFSVNLQLPQNIVVPPLPDESHVTDNLGIQQWKEFERALTNAKLIEALWRSLEEDNDEFDQLTYVSINSRKCKFEFFLHKFEADIAQCQKKLKRFKAAQRKSDESDTTKLAEVADSEPGTDAADRKSSTRERQENERRGTKFTAAMKSLERSSQDDATAKTRELRGEIQKIQRAVNAYVQQVHAEHWDRIYRSQAVETVLRLNDDPVFMRGLTIYSSDALYYQQRILTQLNEARHHQRVSATRNEAHPTSHGTLRNLTHVQNVASHMPDQYWSQPFSLVPSVFFDEHLHHLLMQTNVAVYLTEKDADPIAMNRDYRFHAAIVYDAALHVEQDYPLRLSILDSQEAKVHTFVNSAELEAYTVTIKLRAPRVTSTVYDERGGVEESKGSDLESEAGDRDDESVDGGNESDDAEESKVPIDEDDGIDADTTLKAGADAHRELEDHLRDFCHKVKDSNYLIKKARYERFGRGKNVTYNVTFFISDTMASDGTRRPDELDMDAETVANLDLDEFCEKTRLCDLPVDLLKKLEVIKPHNPDSPLSLDEKHYLNPEDYFVRDDTGLHRYPEPVRLLQDARACNQPLHDLEQAVCSALSTLSTFCREQQPLGDGSEVAIVSESSMHSTLKSARKTFMPATVRPTPLTERSDPSASIRFEDVHDFVCDITRQVHDCNGHSASLCAASRSLLDSAERLDYDDFVSRVQKWIEEPRLSDDDRNCWAKSVERLESTVHDFKKYCRNQYQPKRFDDLLTNYQKRVRVVAEQTSMLTGLEQQLEAMHEVRYPEVKKLVAEVCTVARAARSDNDEAMERRKNDAAKLYEALYHLIFIVAKVGSGRDVSGTPAAAQTSLQDLYELVSFFYHDVARPLINALTIGGNGEVHRNAPLSKEYFDNMRQQIFERLRQSFGWDNAEEDLIRYERSRGQNTTLFNPLFGNLRGLYDDSAGGKDGGSRDASNHTKRGANSLVATMLQDIKDLIEQASESRPVPRRIIQGLRELKGKIQSSSRSRRLTHDDHMSWGKQYNWLKAKLENHEAQAQSNAVLGPIKREYGERFKHTIDISERQVVNQDALEGETAIKLKAMRKSLRDAVKQPIAQFGTSDIVKQLRHLADNSFMHDSFFEMVEQCLLMFLHRTLARNNCGLDFKSLFADDEFDVTLSGKRVCALASVLSDALAEQFQVSPSQTHIKVSQQHINCMIIELAEARQRLLVGETKQQKQQRDHVLNYELVQRACSPVYEVTTGGGDGRTPINLLNFFSTLEQLHERKKEVIGVVNSYDAFATTMIHPTLLRFPDVFCLLVPFAACKDTAKHGYWVARAALMDALCDRNLRNATEFPEQWWDESFFTETPPIDPHAQRLAGAHNFQLSAPGSKYMFPFDLQNELAELLCQHGETWMPTFCVKHDGSDTQGPKGEALKGVLTSIQDSTEAQLRLLLMIACGCDELSAYLYAARDGIGDDTHGNAQFLSLHNDVRREIERTSDDEYRKRARGSKRSLDELRRDVRKHSQEVKQMGDVIDKMKDKKQEKEDNKDARQDQYSLNQGIIDTLTAQISMLQKEISVREANRKLVQTRMNECKKELSDREKLIKAAETSEKESVYREICDSLLGMVDSFFETVTRCAQFAAGIGKTSFVKKNAKRSNVRNYYRPGAVCTKSLQFVTEIMRSMFPDDVGEDALPWELVDGERLSHPHPDLDDIDLRKELIKMRKRQERLLARLRETLDDADPFRKAVKWLADLVLLCAEGTTRAIYAWPRYLSTLRKSVAESLSQGRNHLRKALNMEPLDASVLAGDADEAHVLMMGKHLSGLFSQVSTISEDNALHVRQTAGEVYEICKKMQGSGSKSFKHRRVQSMAEKSVMDMIVTYACRVSHAATKCAAEVAPQYTTEFQSIWDYTAKTLGENEQDSDDRTFADWQSELKDLKVQMRSVVNSYNNLLPIAMLEVNTTPFGVLHDIQHTIAALPMETAPVSYMALLYTKKILLPLLAGDKKQGTVARLEPHEADLVEILGQRFLNLQEVAVQVLGAQEMYGGDGDADESKGDGDGDAHIKAAAAMSGSRGVAVRDRKKMLKTVPQSFVASEAVQWLQSHEYAASAAEGTALCQRMLDAELINNPLSSRKGASFGNDKTLFVFVHARIEELQRQGDAGGFGMFGGGGNMMGAPGDADESKGDCSPASASLFDLLSSTDGSEDNVAGIMDTAQDLRDAFGGDQDSMPADQTMQLNCDALQDGTQLILFELLKLSISGIRESRFSSRVSEQFIKTQKPPDNSDISLMIDWLEHCKVGALRNLPPALIEAKRREYTGIGNEMAERFSDELGIAYSRSCMISQGLTHVSDSMLQLFKVVPNVRCARELLSAFDTLCAQGTDVMHSRDGAAGELLCELYTAEDGTIGRKMLHGFWNEIAATADKMERDCKPNLKTSLEDIKNASAEFQEKARAMVKRLIGHKEREHNQAIESAREKLNNHAKEQQIATQGWDKKRQVENAALQKVSDVLKELHGFLKAYHGDAYDAIQTIRHEFVPKYTGGYATLGHRQQVFRSAFNASEFRGNQCRGLIIEVPELQGMRVSGVLLLPEDGRSRATPFIDRGVFPSHIRGHDKGQRFELMCTEPWIWERAKQGRLNQMGNFLSAGWQQKRGTVKLELSFEKMEVSRARGTGNTQQHGSAQPAAQQRGTGNTPGVPAGTGANQTVRPGAIETVRAGAIETVREKQGSNTFKAKVTGSGDGHLQLERIADESTTYRVKAEEDQTLDWVSWTDDPGELVRCKLEVRFPIVKVRPEPGRTGQEYHARVLNASGGIFTVERLPKNKKEGDQFYGKHSGALGGSCWDSSRNPELGVGAWIQQRFKVRGQEEYFWGEIKSFDPKKTKVMNKNARGKGIFHGPGLHTIYFAKDNSTSERDLRCTTFRAMKYTPIQVPEARIDRTGDADWLRCDVIDYGNNHHSVKYKFTWSVGGKDVTSSRDGVLGTRKFRVLQHAPLTLEQGNPRLLTQGHHTMEQAGRTQTPAEVTSAGTQPAAGAAGVSAPAPAPAPSRIARTIFESINIDVAVHDVLDLARRPVPCTVYLRDQTVVLASIRCQRGMLPDGAGLGLLKDPTNAQKERLRELIKRFQTAALTAKEKWSGDPPTLPRPADIYKLKQRQATVLRDIQRKYEQELLQSKVVKLCHSIDRVVPKLEAQISNLFAIMDDVRTSLAAETHTISDQWSDDAMAGRVDLMERVWDLFRKEDQDDTATVLLSIAQNMRYVQEQIDAVRDAHKHRLDENRPVKEGGLKNMMSEDMINAAADLGETHLPPDKLSALQKHMSYIGFMSASYRAASIATEDDVRHADSLRECVSICDRKFLKFLGGSNEQQRWRAQKAKRALDALISRKNKRVAKVTVSNSYAAKLNAKQEADIESIDLDLLDEFKQTNQSHAPLTLELRDNGGRLELSDIQVDVDFGTHHPRAAEERREIFILNTTEEEVSCKINPKPEIANTARAKIGLAEHFMIKPNASYTVACCIQLDHKIDAGQKSKDVEHDADLTFNSMQPSADMGTAVAHVKLTACLQSETFRVEYAPQILDFGEVLVQEDTTGKHHRLLLTVHNPITSSTSQVKLGVWGQPVRNQGYSAKCVVRERGKRDDWNEDRDFVQLAPGKTKHFEVFLQINLFHESRGPKRQDLNQRIVVGLGMKSKCPPPHISLCRCLRCPLLPIPNC